MPKIKSREKTKEQIREDLRKTREELAVQKWGIEKTLGGMKVLVKELIQRGKEIEEAKVKNEAILMSIGDGLVVVDKAGKVLLVNKAFENLVGWKVKEVLGKLLVEVVPREDEAGNVVPFKERILNKILSTTTTTTTTTVANWYYIRKNKTRFPVASIITPFIIEGKIIGAVEVFRDISKEKDVDKAKTEFVSLASHQLKTPPTAIKLLTERMLSGKTGKLTEKQKEYLNDVHSENQRSIELVNALLNVSRIEMGAFTIQLNEKNICAVAQSVIYELKSAIDKKHLRLEEVHPKRNIAVPIDEALFRMVLNNLVMNAVNYTAEGGTIHVECKEVNKGQTLGEKLLEENSFVVVVSDTGYGIPKLQQDKLFTKFFRADNAREKQPDGTGLGLYIVKSILDNSGGLIWFTSRENEGSVFYVAIPVTGMRVKAGEKKIIS